LQNYIAVMTVACAQVDETAYALNSPRNGRRESASGPSMLGSLRWQTHNSTARHVTGRKQRHRMLSEPLAIVHYVVNPSEPRELLDECSNVVEFPQIAGIVIVAPMVK
jgi:hypothetical protein